MMMHANSFYPLMTSKRCGLPEVIHYGALSVVTEKDTVFDLGPSECLIILRSTAKPFFLGALLNDVLSRESFSDKEIALMASSHNGEVEHLSVLSDIMSRYGICKSDLKCGVHSKYSSRSKLSIEANNCSGKHVMFLVACKVSGQPFDTYLDGSNRIHTGVRESLEKEVFQCKMYPGIDGCSIPTYGIPLKCLARAYAKLATGSLGASYSRVARAILSNPFMIGGWDCLDSYFIEKYGWIAKSGSDGVWALGLPEKGIGIAVKIFRGLEKPAQAVLVHYLLAQGLLTLKGNAFLTDFYTTESINWSGNKTGEIEFW